LFQGSWLRKGLTAKFYEPSNNLTNWIVASDKNLHVNVAKIFIAKLKKIGADAGMQIQEPKKYCQVNLEQLEQLFKGKLVWMRVEVAVIRQ
jgi:hypothetical protein